MDTFFNIAGPVRAITLVLALAVSPSYAQDSNQDSVNKSNKSRTKSRTVKLQQPNQGDDDYALTREAILMGRTGQYDRALQKFQRVLSQQQNRISKTYNNIGYIYELKGNTQKAINYYKKAISLNQNQVESKANLGHLYFTQKKWTKAVEYGEATLKLYPEHKEVKKWLPIAYEKLLQKRKQKVLGRPSRDKKKNNVLATFQLNYESRLLTKILPDQEALQLASYEGLRYPYKAPTLLQLWYFPLKSWSVHIKHESPYFGVNNPHLLYARQSLSFYYNMGHIHLGGGILTSQMNTNQIKDNDEDLIFDFPNASISDVRTDYKLGFTFGYDKGSTQYFLQYYPRLFPRVTKNTGGLAYDYSEFHFKLLNYMAHYKVFLDLLIREAYIYQFNVDLDNNGNIISGNKALSHYFGHTDLTLGVDFKVMNKGEGVPFDWYMVLEWGARLYLRDIKNENPFGLLNGQGYFGFAPTSFLEGNMFPGAGNTAVLLRFDTSQKFTPNLRLKEGLELEFLTGGGHNHGFTMTMGLEYIYY